MWSVWPSQCTYASPPRTTGMASRAAASSQMPSNAATAESLRAAVAPRNDGIAHRRRPPLCDTLAVGHLAAARADLHLAPIAARVFVEHERAFGNGDAAGHGQAIRRPAE